MGDIVLVEGSNELNIGMVPIPPPLANLYGVVTDAETGYAIEGVKVTIDAIETFTNALGQYLFEGLTPGSYVIQFSKEGYETIVM